MKRRISFQCLAPEDRELSQKWYFRHNPQRQRRRTLALKAIRNGQTLIEVCHMQNVRRKTSQRRVNLYLHDGFAALVTPKQMAVLPPPSPQPLSVLRYVLLTCFIKTDHQDQGYFETVEGTVTHATVIETISGFIRQRTPEKLTIVVMDNASVHKKAVKQAQWAWLAHSVWIWFLPPYSPELKSIEILWKKIKYEWLPWAA